jgi:hypothetical protein
MASLAGNDAGPSPQSAAAREAPAHLRRHLEATRGWLVESIDHGNGGSCAHFSPLGGWSRPYPETTGYLIPTLLALSRAQPEFDGEGRATALGSWLLSLQDREGWWRGGVHPAPADTGPSVFNTAQILQGLTALHDLGGEQQWLEAAVRACGWLARGVDEDGLWPHKDYRATGTPSYYTYAAWPMLEVASRAGDDAIRAVAEGVLDAILARRRSNGAFAGWGFSKGEAAFTHTIAYTFQGLLGSARALDDWNRYGEPATEGLLALAERADQAGGKLAGRLNDDWSAAARFVCLTGNAQLALCLLDLHERRPDPKLVEIASRLVEAVCAAQRLRAPIAGIRGAVGGSSPIWGRYMTLRYPNWAAKYHCDALLRLIDGPAPRRDG